MAEVYLAKSVGAEGIEKQLVIKRVLPDLAQNSRFVEMFIAEARIAMGLNHPNIVQIYDFGKVDGDFFLAMEHVDGWDLGQLLRASRQLEQPLSVGNAVFLALEVARGLDYAHRRQDAEGRALELVHRDISPQNILVSRDGTVKIVDFGIAKAATHADEAPHVVKGKFSYMSPEQAMGKEVDHRSDLFSLGIVLFEMLCGRSLFKQEDTDQTLSLVKSAVVPDIVSLNPTIPPQLEHLIYKLLAQDPAQRYPSARLLQQELIRVLFAYDEIFDTYSIAEEIQAYVAWLQARENPLTTQGPGVQGTVALTQSSTRGGSRTREHTVSHTPVTPIHDDEALLTPTHQMGLASLSRKEAVVIMGRVEGLGPLRARIGQDRWLGLFQEYTRIVESIAYKSDGIVDRVGDDGFSMILGLPVSSENDTERAARVAIDLHDALAGLSQGLEVVLELSIGIAITDVVLEQEIDSGGKRYNWSFYGDSHRFAQRLAREAMSRETLIGGQVWRRLRRDYHFESVATSLPPGAPQTPERGAPPDELAKAWRLLGPKNWRERIKEVKHTHHAFFGRDLELRNLRSAYRRTLLEGLGMALVVTGEQGVGKSALVEEFLRGLNPRDVRVVRGVTNPFEQDVPLGGLSTLLAELMRLGSPADSRQFRATLETRVRALFPHDEHGEREMILHSLGAIFGQRYPGSVFEELAGEERRRRASLTLRKVLGRFAQKKPFVLTIDDAHHIDAMTLELVTQLFDSRYDAPIFVIFTIRRIAHIQHDERWQKLFQARHVQVETLPELSPQEARQMIEEMMRIQRVERPDVVESILRRAGGNPFYIREIFEVLRDRGGLTSQAPQNLPTELGAEDSSLLPTSVEGLISARVDRLNLPIKRALQYTSLLWSPFEAKEVEAIFGPGVTEWLESLVEQKFLEHPSLHDLDQDPVHEDAKGSYQFVNPLIQEVAARTLLGEEARQMHHRIADHMLAQRHLDSVMARALLAHHLARADRPQEAVVHFLAAAQGALAQFGAHESLRLCEHVFECASPEQSEEAWAALWLKERIVHDLGMTAEHKETLDLLFRHVKARGTLEERGRVLLSMARYHYRQTELKSAAAILQQARQWAQKHALTALEAETHYHDSYIQIDQGDRHGAALSLDHARRIFASLPSPGDDAARTDGLVRCHMIAGILARRMGQHHLALESYDQALALTEEVGVGGSSKLRRTLWMNVGLAHVSAGSYAQGLNFYERALASARHLGLRMEEAGILVNLGHACHLIGQEKLAISHTQRGVYMARKAGANTILADGEITLGVCYLEEARVGMAERCLSEGLRLAESIPNLYLAIHAMSNLAWMRVASGRDQDARIALFQAEDCLDRCLPSGMTWGVIDAHVLLAKIYHILQDHTRAFAHLQHALDTSATHHIPLDVRATLAAHELLSQGSKEQQNLARDLACAAWESVRARTKNLVEEEHRKSHLQRPSHRALEALCDAPARSENEDS